MAYRLKAFSCDSPFVNAVSDLYVVEYDCNTALTAEGDVLQSPNHPNNMTCQSLIEAPEGHVVSLNITNFYLELDGDAQGGCPSDYDTLKFYDGPDESSPLLGEFCDTLIPETIKSSGRNLYVVFRSDHKIAFPWYQAYISFIGKNIFISIVTVSRCSCQPKEK